MTRERAGVTRVRADVRGGPVCGCTYMQVTAVWRGTAADVRRVRAGVRRYLQTTAVWRRDLAAGVRRVCADVQCEPACGDYAPMGCGCPVNDTSVSPACRC